MGDRRRNKERRSIAVRSFVRPERNLSDKEGMLLKCHAADSHSVDGHHAESAKHNAAHQWKRRNAHSTTHTTVLVALRGSKPSGGNTQGDITLFDVQVPSMAEAV